MIFKLGSVRNHLILFCEFDTIPSPLQFISGLLPAQWWFYLRWPCPPLLTKSILYSFLTPPSLRGSDTHMFFSSFKKKWIWSCCNEPSLTPCPTASCSFECKAFKHCWSLIARQFLVSFLLTLCSLLEHFHTCLYLSRISDSQRVSLTQMSSLISRSVSLAA